MGDVQTPNNPRPSPPLSPSCLTIPSGTRVPRSTARAPASAASASTRPASSASTASTAADSASASAPTSSASRSRGKSCSVVVGAAVLIRARPLYSPSITSSTYKAKPSMDAYAMARWWRAGWEMYGPGSVMAGLVVFAGRLAVYGTHDVGYGTRRLAGKGTTWNRHAVPSLPHSLFFLIADLYQPLDLHLHPNCHTS